MTDNNIKDMQPGMEMDRLVAEAIFGGELWEPFQPSTDISDARKVETELQRKGLADDYAFELVTLVDAFEVSFKGTNINAFKIAHASPLDRCKAALLAMNGGDRT